MKKYVAFAFGLLGAAFATAASAETLGYAEAIDRLATACKADIAKYCKSEPLGGGRVVQCLQTNRKVSTGCSTSVAALQSAVATRRVAQDSVPKVCDADAKRLCGGVVAGDGNLMECYEKAKARFGAACRQAVADAGYERAPRGSGPIKLSSTQLVDSLSKAENTPATVLSAAQLRQLASASLNDPNRASRANRGPLTGGLDQLAQFTIAVEFDLNSARIRPDSFRAVGLMADSLNHPYLMGYRFIVVGHTDATGDRAHNLKLSEARAEAIRDALVSPFNISPARLEAVGLGEEQLLDARNPASAKNRRVQLINVGK